MKKDSSVLDIVIECLRAESNDRNPDEWLHCRRVGMLCAITAREMGWEPDEIADLKLAALLHHMDKSNIPESVLAPRIADYLGEYNRRTSKPTARRRTSSTDRPTEAADIIIVADTFDHLISNQRYRVAFSDSNAFEILQHDADKAFDMTTVEAFSRAYKGGSFLRYAKAA